MKRKISSPSERHQKQARHLLRFVLSVIITSDSCMQYHSDDLMSLLSGHLPPFFSFLHNVYCSIHLFPCYTPFYLALKEIPAHVGYMSLYIIYQGTTRDPISASLITHQQSSTVYVINHLYLWYHWGLPCIHPPPQPSALTYRFSTRPADCRLGCATFVKDGKKRVCVVLAHSIDVFPVGRPLFFQNSV